MTNPALDERGLAMPFQVCWRNQGDIWTATVIGDCHPWYELIEPDQRTLDTDYELWLDEQAYAHDLATLTQE